MKRFLVFACCCHYPSGGWDDFVKDFDARKDAEAAARNAARDLCQTHRGEAVGDVIDTQRVGDPAVKSLTFRIHVRDVRVTEEVDEEVTVEF